jgi:predicted helicase
MIHPISPFVVCSDKSNEKIGECEPQLWLQELGIKVSNKKEDLEIFLKSKRKNKVIFSTYQSGKILARNIKALNRKIDFAFFDEAHNTATSKNKLSSYLTI